MEDRKEGVSEVVKVVEAVQPLARDGVAHIWPAVVTVSAGEVANTLGAVRDGGVVICSLQAAEWMSVQACWAVQGCRGAPFWLTKREPMGSWECLLLQQ